MTSVTIQLSEQEIKALIFERTLRMRLVLRETVGN
jgi:hypothetical protein